MAAPLAFEQQDFDLFMDTLIHENPDVPLGEGISAFVSH